MKPKMSKLQRQAIERLAMIKRRGSSIEEARIEMYPAFPCAGFAEAFLFKRYGVFSGAFMLAWNAFFVSQDAPYPMVSRTARCVPTGPCGISSPVGRIL